MKLDTTSKRTFANSARYSAAAAATIAGGVNSNVRLCATPRCFERAEGAYLVDIDGNSYIDYALGMGPAILGHAHPTVLAAVTASLTRPWGGAHLR